MQRLKSITQETAQEQTRQLLDTAQKVFGMVPNIAKVLANSPTVLESWLAFGQIMEKASIGQKLQHQLFLLTSEENSSSYCTSILCAIAPEFGLATDDVSSGRTGNAADRRADAALKFAKAVLSNGGKVSDEQLNAVRKAGFSDEQVVEIVGSVTLGCLANFVNNVANTDLDFVRAEPISSLASCAATA